MNKTWMKYVLTFAAGVVIATIICFVHFINLLKGQQQYIKDLSENNINHYKYLYSERAEPLIKLSNAYSQQLISENNDNEQGNLSSLLVNISLFLTSVTYQNHENKQATFNTMLFFYAKTHSTSDIDRNENWFKEIITYCKNEVYYEDCSKETLNNTIDKIIEFDSSDAENQPTNQLIIKGFN